jgi:hypothetical protein
MNNYAVIDRQTKTVIKRYPLNTSLELQAKYRRLATSFVNRKDNEYGAYRYQRIIEEQGV